MRITNEGIAPWMGPKLSLMLAHSKIAAWGKVNEIPNNDKGDHIQSGLTVKSPYVRI